MRIDFLWRGFMLACQALSETQQESKDLRALNASVYILGAAKGIERYLPGVIENAYTVASLFKSYTIIIFCSKVDQLPLDGWMSSDANVHTLPDELKGGTRTSRLATARNSLLKAARTRMHEKNQSSSAVFIAMMDMDNVNGYRFNRTVLEQVLAMGSQWDSVSFNRPIYYDIWALRYQQFDINVWGVNNSRGLISIIQRDITSRLHQWDSKISSESPFLPVYSAFNGFALYRMDAVGDCQYDGTDKDAVTGTGHGRGERDSPGQREEGSMRDASPAMPTHDFPRGSSGVKEDCEHVAFHRCLRKTRRARIVICKHMLLTYTKCVSS